jgi:hypothetical protein
MKTNVTFQDRVPYVALIIKDEFIDKYRQLITTISKGIIKKEHTPKERGDNSYCIEMENIQYHLLLFFKTAPEDCKVTNYTLSHNENIRIDFSNDEHNRVSEIRILFKSDTKTAGVQWNDYIRVRSRKELLAKDLTRYEVSWSSIGAISVKDAQEFATGLNVAVTLAQECTEQFVPSGSNPIQMWKSPQK